MKNNKKTIIRIGSRESRLAVTQAEIVKEIIEKNDPGIQAEIITMKTTGDKILNQSLEAVGGKGLFVKELDKALLDGQIDIAVHSLKDMPMETPAELPILAYTKREDPRDILIYKAGRNEFPVDGTIGTSSRRRMLQFQALYPDCTFAGIRGNVQTRLKKLSEEDYDGTVLAMAGLCRMGMEDIAGRIFAPEEMVPAAGQGILAVQGRKGENYPWTDCLNDPLSEAAAFAERRFAAVLGGDCTAPTAAYARICGSELKLTGLYYQEAEGRYLIDKKTGVVTEAEAIGESLALEMEKKFLSC